MFYLIFRIQTAKKSVRISGFEIGFEEKRTYRLRIFYQKQESGHDHDHDGETPIWEFEKWNLFVTFFVCNLFTHSF